MELPHQRAVGGGGPGAAPAPAAVERGRAGQRRAADPATPRAARGDPAGGSGRPRTRPSTSTASSSTPRSSAWTRRRWWCATRCSARSAPRAARWCCGRSRPVPGQTLFQRLDAESAARPAGPRQLRPRAVPRDPGHPRPLALPLLADLPHRARSRGRWSRRTPRPSPGCGGACPRCSRGRGRDEPGRAGRFSRGRSSGSPARSSPRECSHSRSGRPAPKAVLTATSGPALHALPLLAVLEAVMLACSTVALRSSLRRERVGGLRSGSGSASPRRATRSGSCCRWAGARGRPPAR